MRTFKFVFLILSVVFAAYGNPYPEKFEGRFEGWKSKKNDLIAFFLPKNPVILVAGGHYGNEAIGFSKLWPESKIIVFEPNPHAFELLLTKTSTLSNVEAYQLALNDKSGSFPFYICHGSEGNNPIFEHASSLLKPGPTMQIHYQGPVINVNCVNLDEWNEKKELEHIVDFMRLDLQGSELQVLKSIPKLLSNIKVIHVNTFLYPFREEITQYQKLKSFLENSGFSLLAHWYQEGLVGDAIFIKNDFYDSF